MKAIEAIRNLNEYLIEEQIEHYPILSAVSHLEHLYGGTVCVTLMSESLLKRLFGVNYEYLLDHANGIEPCTIADILKYEAKSKAVCTFCCSQGIL